MLQECSMKVPGGDEGQEIKEEIRTVAMEEGNEGGRIADRRER